MRMTIASGGTFLRSHACGSMHDSSGDHLCKVGQADCGCVAVDLRPLVGVLVLQTIDHCSAANLRME